MSDATPDPALSHTVGPKEPALLEQTIGDNLDATVARVPDGTPSSTGRPASG